MNETPPKYFIYSRKSSEDNKERQMQSIESQRDELNKVRHTLSLHVVDSIEEEKSAHTRGRLKFGEMMKRIERGEANAILTWHGNRLARNAYDGGWIITLMDEGKIIEVKTPYRTYYNTPDDKFFLQLEFGMSKKDSDDKSIVVKRGLMAKAQKGQMPGVAPLGYLNTPELVGGSRFIKKDTERFEMVKRAWEMMASGKYSVAQIQKIMNEEWSFRTRRFKRQGGKLLSMSQLYKTFNDTFYYGPFEYPRRSGIWHNGEHEKMINEDTYKKVQFLLKRRLRAKPQTKNFAYTGQILCGECGSAITAYEHWKQQKNGNVHHYIHYQCTKSKNANCVQRTIRVEILEAQIKSELEKITIPKEFHTFAMKWFRFKNAQEFEVKETVLASQQKAYADCVSKLNGIIDMRAAGELTALEFSKRKDELSEEKARLEQLLENTGGEVDKWMEIAENVFAFATHAKERFETGDWQVRKQILSAIGSNLTLKDQKLNIDMEKTLIPMQTISNELRFENDWLEPPKNISGKRKTEVFASASPALLRGEDLNLRPSGYEPDELPDCSTPR
jgi:site-specific DNA recombinase